MIISPDAGSQIDGIISKIVDRLPELPVAIMPISWFPNFLFKPPVVGKWILVDFMEPHNEHPEYDKFDAWVKENPPILTFRRELNKRSVSPVVKPIEFVCSLHIPPVQSKQDFDSRPIEVLNFWGYSHRQRPKLHGDIFRQGMANHGLNVISSWNLQVGPHTWASIYTPCWERKPMIQIVDWMLKSKITVSMPGNGRKAFRHGECVGTLMALQRDDLAWSYPWDDTNSVGLVPEMEFFSLLEATRRSDLYELYIACDANMRKYEATTYTMNYVLPEIQKVL